MAGRKPKPTAMKELEGNPGKRKLNKKEPIPAKGMHICPEWLMPEAMNDVVYERLIDLCTDICKRNGKTKLIWFGNKTKSLAYEPKDNEMIITVHRWFANKSCPGEWLYARLGDLAEKVTARLGGAEEKAETPVQTNGMSNADCPFVVKVSIVDLNIRKSAGTNTAKTGKYTGVGSFTIT